MQIPVNKKAATDAHNYNLHSQFAKDEVLVKECDSFDIAELRAWDEKFKGKTSDQRMKSGQKRPENLKTCKEVDHKEYLIQEWFPTLIQARARGKALNPLGAFEMEHRKDKMGGSRFSYNCKTKISETEKCHASYKIKEILPDQYGNRFGLYGCLKVR
jgi:hypothetical protein